MSADAPCAGALAKPTTSGKRGRRRRELGGNRCTWWLWRTSQSGSWFEGEREWLTIVCLFVRPELVFESERPVTIGMTAWIRLGPRRHVSEYDVVPKKVRFVECGIAPVTLRMSAKSEAVYRVPCEIHTYSI
jgi:hypothetical protein